MKEEEGRTVEGDVSAFVIIEEDSWRKEVALKEGREK